CTICGETKTEAIPAAGHTAVTDAAVAPTCTETGLTEGSHCSVCGEIIVAQKVVAATDHDWGNWTANGDDTHTRICTNDSSHTQTESCTYELTGHDDSSNPSTHTYTCSICDGQKQEACVFTSTVVLPATCNATGTMRYTCDTCGYTYDETIPLTSHTYGEGVTVAPTCTEEGYTLYKCTVCGYSYKDKRLVPLGHSWGDWVTNNDGTHTHTCLRDSSHIETEDCSYGMEVVTSPTCESSGLERYTCIDCGYSYDVTTDPLGHDWGDWVSNNDGTHSRTCDNDGSHIESEGCTFDEGVQTLAPTCTEEGVMTYTCTKCGYSYTEAIAELGHDWGDWVSNSDGTHTRTCKNDPSHTESGECTYTDLIGHDDGSDPSVHSYACPYCKDVIHSACEFSSIVLFEATCSAEGTMQYTCGICGYVYEEAIPMTPHEYDNGVVVAPTCTQNGYTLYSCKNCSYSYEAKKTASLGHQWGDWTSNSDGTHTRTCERDSSHTETESCAYTIETLSEPNCTTAGRNRYTCSVCGYNYEAEIPALGHDWGDWVSNGDGSHTRTCSRDVSHTETTACTYGEGEVILEPTCGSLGTMRYTCSECAYSYEEDIPMSDHAWGAWSSNNDGTHTRVCTNDSSHVETKSCVYVNAVTDPTCLENGYTTHACGDCGYSYIDSETTALGHDYQRDTARDVAATCTETGIEAYSCSRCDSTDDKTTEALGHDYVAVVT
ncbi:MAG TPA: hypothetical protein PLM48_04510, partial [Clostridia bacterium]|nr:hypothetical protein [Clostridia bacterium]